MIRDPVVAEGRNLPLAVRSPSIQNRVYAGGGQLLREQGEGLIFRGNETAVGKNPAFCGE